MIHKILSYLSDFGALAAIITLFIELLSMTGRIHVRISNVYSFSDFDKYFHPNFLDLFNNNVNIGDTGRVLFSCNIGNKSSRLVDVSVYGYCFHFGKDLYRDQSISVDLNNALDLCGILSVKPDSSILSVSSNSGIDVSFGNAQRVSLLDNKIDRFCRNCILIGRTLRQDVLVVVCEYRHHKKVVYYNVSNRCTVSHRSLLMMKLKARLHNVLFCFKRDFDVIPDDAYSTIDVVSESLSNMDLSDKIVLSDCNDDYFGAFSKYFWYDGHCRCKAFVNVSKLRYGRPSLVDVNAVDDADAEIRCVMSLCSHDLGFKLSSEEQKSVWDFRDNNHRKLLSIVSLVTTCPPQSLFSEYVSVLLEEGVSFKILGTVNLLRGFESMLAIADNEVFDAMFYVPFDFDFNRHRIFKSKCGEPMIKVKNCCWFIPKGNSKSAKMKDVSES